MVDFFSYFSIVCQGLVEYNDVFGFSLLMVCRRGKRDSQVSPLFHLKRTIWDNGNLLHAEWYLCNRSFCFPLLSLYFFF